MLDLGFPLYAAKFVDAERAVVAGGGGEGKHGIKNKVALVRYVPDDESPVLEAELELTGEDAPSSVATWQDTIYVGANRAVAARRTGKNTHLRVLDLSLAERAAHDVFETADPGVYQRVTAASEKQVALAAAGGTKALVVVVDRQNLATHNWSAVLDNEVLDLSFSTDGGLLAICTEKAIFVHKATNGVLVHEIAATAPLKWARVAFASPSRLAAAAHARIKGRVELAVFKFDDRVIEIRRSRIPGARAVTTLAATSKRFAVGTPGGDVLVFNPRLSLLCRVRNSRELPVTAVTISPDESVVLAVTLAGEVQAQRIPDNPASVWYLPQTIGWVAASAALVALLAFLAVLLMKKDLLLSGRDASQHFDHLSSTTHGETLVETHFTTIVDTQAEKIEHHIPGVVEVPLHRETVPRDHMPVEQPTPSDHNIHVDSDEL